MFSSHIWANKHISHVSLSNKVSVICVLTLSHIFITLYCGYIFSLGVTKG